MFMFILAYIYILFVLDIYIVAVLSMHRLFIIHICIDRSFVYRDIQWLYDSEKKTIVDNGRQPRSVQQSTRVASRGRPCSRRRSPPAAKELTICVVNTMKYRHWVYYRQSITITFGQSITITFGQSISITGQFQSVTITITRPSPLLIGHCFALDRLLV